MRITVSQVKRNGRYQLLDPLRPEELSALRADIQKRGVLVAVEEDEDGNTLDGHHRKQIAAELGIKCPVKVRRFATEEEKREHVIKLNLARRHMDAVRWGKAFAMLLKVRGVRTSRGPKPADASNSATVAELATEVGVPERTARHRLAAARACDELPKPLREAVESGEKTLKEALREEKKAEKEAVRQEAAKEAEKIVADDLHGVHRGDFRDVAKTLADASVDLIFTDPPYDRKTLPLYGDMAEIAARVLKPGGSLITYLGQYQIHEVCTLIAPHLRLWWTLCCLHTGQSARMTEYGVVVKWKPMLWFVKGTRGDKLTFVEDLIESNQEKDSHEWQQGIAEAAYYIDKLTLPGGMVFDPFCGGATTAVAAKQLKRRWLTCDVDKAAVALARKRVMEDAA